MALKLTYVAFEKPFPPTHGARVDIWRRLCAFRRLGVEIQLAYWDRVEDTQCTDDEFHDIAESTIVLPLPSGWSQYLRALRSLPRIPWAACKRLMPERVGKSFRASVGDFSPDAIWLDGIWGAAAILPVANELKCPVFVRSHNVEHVYMAEQRRLAPTLRDRAHVALACINIRRYEFDVLRRSELFFDISCDDLEYWRRHGFANGRWLPPLIERTDVDRGGVTRITGAGEVKSAVSVIFLGNLYTPNNVAGVQWLVRQVFPALQEIRRDVALTIAGSNPSREVRAVCDAVEGVTLLENPPDAGAVLRSADVLVNPTPWSSGVNLKSIDMLSSGKPIVSTSMGVRGLPLEARRFFEIADDPVRFAALVARAADCTSDAIANVAAAQEFFGDVAAQAALDEIDLFVGRK